MWGARMSDSKCLVEACNLLARTRGYCRKHYQSHRRRGLLGGSICSIEGCERFSEARGFCGMHWKRWWNTSGDIDYAGNLRERILPCSVGGCESRAQARGLCHGHYTRWRRKGEAGDSPLAVRDGRYLLQGYVAIRMPNHPLAMKGGYVLEHRLVLYEAEIEIPADSHVHHKNGDRADNRLENLEVLSRSEHISVHNPRKDICGKGHSLTDAYVYGNRRQCRECVRERDRERCK